MIKEACVENLTEALTAQKKGASRIELCDHLEVGGTTPAHKTIAESIQLLNIPVFVIIRPRGGDFNYSEEEFETMKSDILFCKQAGIPGVVLGILTPDQQIDVQRTSELIQLARPMQVTFHKAFDEVSNCRQALEDVITSGANRLLTSGTKETAAEGMEILNKLIEQARERITILAAGRVTSENLAELASQIPTNEFHGKKIVGDL